MCHQHDYPSDIDLGDSHSTRAIPSPHKPSHEHIEIVKTPTTMENYFHILGASKILESPS